MASSCSQSIPATLSSVATISLPSSQTRSDFSIFLQRLLRSGEPEVRLVSRGEVLAAYGCVFAPTGLTDPAVLVMRAFQLGEPMQPPLDVTVPARAITDRLARDDAEMQVPPSETMVPWAGVLPPVTGWRGESVIDSESLAKVAKQGVARVAAALPESPGEAVVRKVRAQVWNVEIVPGLPAAAAFAADAMGFLGGEPLRLARSGNWVRLSGMHGHVLTRV